MKVLSAEFDPGEAKSMSLTELWLNHIKSYILNLKCKTYAIVQRNFGYCCSEWIPSENGMLYSMSIQLMIQQLN